MLNRTWCEEHSASYFTIRLAPLQPIWTRLETIQTHTWSYVEALCRCIKYRKIQYKPNFYVAWCQHKYDNMLAYSWCDLYKYIVFSDTMVTSSAYMITSWKHFKTSWRHLKLSWTILRSSSAILWRSWDKLNITYITFKPPKKTETLNTVFYDTKYWVLSLGVSLSNTTLMWAVPVGEYLGRGFSFF